MKTQITSIRRSTLCILLVIALGTFGEISNVQAQSNYFRNQNRAYFGAELSMATPEFSIFSNIAEINNTNVGFFGGNAGVVVGNLKGKLKARVGSYTSNSTVKHTFDLLQAGISGSIYLLRLKEVKFHTLEPYFSVGLNRQQAMFYGNYIVDSNTSKNFSSTGMPMLGQVSWSRATVAVGVEYQLESDTNKFIHLFAEAGYGIPFQMSSSNDAFSQTKTSASSWISIGINVGIVK